MTNKLNSVLIPHDGSPLSGRIVESAEAIVSPGVDVTVMHVITSEGADGGVEETASRLEARGITVTRHNDHGTDAAAALLNFIERNQPELVLMATHGRSGSGRFTRGSVAERVMRECQSPLLMVNPSADTIMPPRRVLVPLDASENSFAVVAPLLNLLSGSDAQVTLLFVDFDDPTDTEELRSKRREQRKQDIAEWFNEPANRISAEGVGLEIRIEHGNPAEKILQIANEPQYDLLAMTTHGRSGIARWAFGSVADKVLSACTKPLLLKRIR